MLYIKQLLYNQTFISIFAWFFFFSSLLWLMKALFLGYYPDFSGYYYGSKYLLENSNPYFGGGSLFTSYVYPPIVLILFLPFTILTFQTAEIVWTILSLIFLLSSLYLLSKIFELRFFSSLNLFLMSLVFISFPSKFSLGMGQINMLVLMLLVISLWFLKQKREFASGVLLGVSLAIKLFPVLLPVYFIVDSCLRRNDRERWKVSLGIFASLLISVLLVLIFVPPKIYSEFISVLSSLVSSWKLDYYNQSFAGFTGRSFGTGEFANVLKLILSGVVVFTAFFAVIKNKQKDFLITALKFGTLITASLLINTFSWQHHFVWLIIPFYVAFFYLKTNRFEKKYFAVLFVSYFLISINFANPQILPAISQSHVFFGTLILFALNIYLLLVKIQKQ